MGGAPRRGTAIGVYLYNRVWRFGTATTVVSADDSDRLVHRAGWLPFGPGRIAHA
ncbi:hypothetical protein P9139_15970 [Curtobacterium flaccumfaciens]|nr:hypothetical protein P9139_15970 [Curtobacterium flaccumfaciens]